ncbi:MAG: carboxynorspermidine decarboxylase [Bacteroidales bacterium]
MRVEDIPSPCFVLEEDKFRKNLELIRSVGECAGVDIILAFKAFSLWKVFPIVREYIGFSTASSLAEAQLAYEEMKSLAHTYAPVYSDVEFGRILECSSHITFNSITQYEHFRPVIATDGNRVSCGLRINPEYSQVETGLYDPCAPGSRLGVTAEKLAGRLPSGIEGLHCHALCESNSFMLEGVLNRIEEKFGHLFDSIKWLNMGGGHLITRVGYDTAHLVALLRRFRNKYPDIRVILEPGSAFAWQTGYLKATILDIVENHGIKTLILNVSFACHMPDCLEMPYRPEVKGAHIPLDNEPVYRLGGNSCLSGDFVGDYAFEMEPKVGDIIILEDMMHYTTVKTTMFNGVSHPSVALLRSDGNIEMLKSFTYSDYKNRMS